MMRFISALAVLLGLATGAHAQATSIQKLPALVMPADSDLLIVEHIAGLPGQKTNAMTAGNLASYIQGKLAGSTLVVSVAGRTGIVSLTSNDLTDISTVGRSFITASTTTAARSSVGAAALGANADITSLSGLTTALSVSQGGTGGATAAAARAGIGSAASGANSDITSLSGITTPLSVAQGGTGDTGGAWSTGSTTATATSGTLGTNTVAYRYKKIGRIVFLQAAISITSAGSSPAGAVNFTLPFAAVAGTNYFGAGRETAVTGAMLSPGAIGSTLTIARYDGTFIGSSSYVLNVSIVYESAS